MSSRTSHRLVLATVLALAAAAASAAPSALSESEMSGVYGRGLSDPTLAAFGALGTAEERAAFASATAAEVSTAMNGLAVITAQDLDRQLSQQRLQAAATGMQTTLKLAQTMSTVSQVLAPIAGLAALPVLGLPFGFTMPVLAGLDTLPKH